MKDSVQNFIDGWNRWDEAQDYSDNIAVDWEARFRDAGYYPARFNPDRGSWTSVYRWCSLHFGDGHYVWTGTTFWFENERDAMWFTLRWS